MAVIVSYFISYMTLNRNSLVWVVLVVLTMITAIITALDSNYIKCLVLIISMMKFLAVAFYFMNLRKAHALWKVSILLFIGVFILIIFWI